MMIVFGLGRLPATAAHQQEAGPHRLPLDRPTLRLWDLVPAPGVAPAEPGQAAAQLAAAEAQLLAACGAWNGAGAAFVRAYFGSLRAGVATRQAALAARAGPLAGLVQPLHWAFAAPLPMPRAWLPGPDGRPAAAPVDLAFRVEGRFVVLCLGSGTRLPSQRRHLEALAAEGARVLDLAGGEADLLARLGPGFADALDAAPLPQTPFRPRPLAPPRAAPV